MYMSSLEERRARRNEIKLVTAALYEAKVKNEEILRVLMKVCEADREEATSAFQNEKFMLHPCRELYQYLILEKGFEEHDADVFVHTKAVRALADNKELSELSPAKMFDTINKAKK
ncbi:hypothetical protein [Parasporobacterium paucivorans]|uniref:Uncharacterized protein n=1 Tax=Parasporobacterium paucivorans DSM 15970 TaxID=1122934 RepID=A0A1M6IPP9_9FIRM|nr:hypothetical protein [Parasporobacterium paucivorans]SHJ36397.1 hypothetical protein SAMN02745691_01817 [Parasporobacterium paucivorans DSM 15970]